MSKVCCSGLCWFVVWYGSVVMCFLVYFFGLFGRYGVLIIEFFMQELGEVAVMEKGADTHCFLPAKISRT